MAAISRPVLYAAAAGLAAIAFLLATGGGDAAPAAPRAPRKRAATPKGDDWDLPAPDPALRFPRLLTPPRDVFAPLVNEERPVAIPRLPNLAQGDLVAIPGGLAGGEGGWTYSGLVEANGVRMALLENKARNQSGYVREGDYWKAARVLSIASPALVLADDKGRELTVYRFDPNAPAKPTTPAAGPSFGPGGVGGALVGPIAPGGRDFSIQPSRTPSR